MNQKRLAKIIFGVILFLSVSLVLGVTGYLMKNKPIKNIESEQKADADNKNPYIKVISPQGGKQWEEGKTYDIKWESLGIKKVGIEVSLGGGPVERIAYEADAETGVFNFNIPAGYLNGLEIAEQTVKAKIYIYAPDIIDRKDGMTGRLSGWSNDYFTIHSDIKPNIPSINIISPNGGEEWKAGNAYEIKWLSNEVGKVNIILEDMSRADESGGYFLNIAHDLEASSGKYNWKIPEDIPSSKYKIKVERDDEKKKYVKSLSTDYFDINGLLSAEEQERMLKQMFSNNEISGNKIVTSDYSVYLERIDEGAFLRANQKSYLFTVRLSGVPHAGGLEHAFIGVFDDKKKLATPPISAPMQWENSYDFSFGHLGGDIVNLDFRDCGGVKYILADVGGCPNGGLCDNAYHLIKVENNTFKTVQDVVQKLTKPWEDGAQMVMKGDNILVYNNKFVNAGFVCKAPNCLNSTSYSESKDIASIYSEQLTWDKNTCQFKN